MQLDNASYIFLQFNIARESTCTQIIFSKLFLQNLNEFEKLRKIIDTLIRVYACILYDQLITNKQIHQIEDT